MSDKRWKSTERKVALYFGGQRVPVTGRQRGDVPDILHPDLSTEVKDRNKLPDWLFDAMNQAEESQKRDQIPVVVLHQKGDSIAESLAVLRVKDVVQLLERIKKLEIAVEIAVDELRHYEQ